MSKVHVAMRSLERMEHKDMENSSSNASSHLVGALLAELADEVGDDPRLEAVRMDLIAASRCFDDGKKKDLALRFYLAFRSLLRENEALQGRLRKAEKKSHASDAEANENISISDGPEENGKQPMGVAAAAAGTI
jgi:hypothetical protein